LSAVSRRERALLFSLLRKPISETLVVSLLLLLFGKSLVPTMFSMFTKSGSSGGENAAEASIGHFDHV